MEKTVVFDKDNKKIDTEPQHIILPGTVFYLEKYKMLRQMKWKIRKVRNACRLP